MKVIFSQVKKSTEPTSRPEPGLVSKWNDASRQKPAIDSGAGSRGTLTLPGEMSREAMRFIVIGGCTMRQVRPLYGNRHGAVCSFTMVHDCAWVF